MLLCKCSLPSPSIVTCRNFSSGEFLISCLQIVIWLIYTPYISQGNWLGTGAVNKLKFQGPSRFIHAWSLMEAFIRKYISWNTWLLSFPWNCKKEMEPAHPVWSLLPRNNMHNSSLCHPEPVTGLLPNCRGGWEKRAYLPWQICWALKISASNPINYAPCHLCSVFFRPQAVPDNDEKGHFL